MKGVNHGDEYQTLLGVTGSGKTFTMANVIQAVQKPTLIMSHNKTLAAQLYGEFKQLFPNNAVEFLSPITITTNRKLIYRSQIHLLKKICP